jgi:ABC-type protease/lipase transport system fused ATPase/permease subunit
MVSCGHAFKWRRGDPAVRPFILAVVANPEPPDPDAVIAAAQAAGVHDLITGLKAMRPSSAITAARSRPDRHSASRLPAITVVVAHRPSAIAGVDYILVMAKGRQ